jgi:hypothetical protein
VSLPTDDPADIGDDSDPLLLFANEPGLAAPPEPVVKIPNEITPAGPPLELAELRHRAEAAERSLRETKEEVAALKRQMANLVAVREELLQATRAQIPAQAPAQTPAQTPAQAKALPAQRRAQWGPLAAALMFMLVVAGMVGWRWSNSPAPEVVAVQPVVEAAGPPLPEKTSPFVAAAAISPLPAPSGSARSREPVETPLRTRYVGTLSVDAVPAGGEVFINRKSVGMTPARITGLRAGSHLVWIERDGYRLFTRVVTVPADKVTRVSVALEPENQPPARP